MGKKMSKSSLATALLKQKGWLSGFERQW